MSKGYYLFYLSICLVIGCGFAQVSPYKTPAAIEEVQLPQQFKGQIQAWYWANLAEYDRANAYHDLTMYPKKPLDNPSMRNLMDYDPVSAKRVILKRAADETVVMFNEAHHKPETRAYLRRLLPELKDLGYDQIAIEGFDESRIKADGSILVKNESYHNEPQFLKLLRKALSLNMDIYGYDSQQLTKGSGTREMVQAGQILEIHKKSENGKTLILAGYDHINERTDHPQWGKAMAAEFKEISQIDPLTVQQAEMTHDSDRRFTNPVLRAIPDLHRPSLLQSKEGKFWAPDNGDEFDLVVFHPRNRSVKNIKFWELDNTDRLLDFTATVPEDLELGNLAEPLRHFVYLQSEIEALGDEASPYDVRLFDSVKSGFALFPSMQQLTIRIIGSKGNMVEYELDSLPATHMIIKNGEVLTEAGWESKDLYLMDGIFRDPLQGQPDTIIDASNMKITPGFTDGHTHNLDRRWQRGLTDKYLSEGTLYIQNLTSKSRGVENFRKYLSERDFSPEVRYSNWGFTSTYGHPFMAYEPYTMRLGDRSNWDKYEDSIRNSRKDLYNSYAFVDSVDQLSSIWPDFLDTKPDLVKIYFFNEDKIEKQNLGGHGLRYEVAKAIIDSAHLSGLDVYAHIGTADDFEKMVEAGVDGFAHMPGLAYRGDSTTLDKYFLTDSVLLSAAARGIIINPTAALVKYYLEGDSLQKVSDYQFDMIQRYREKGGKIIVGSDMFNSTATKAYNYYASQFNFSDIELLNLLSRESSRATFPELAIGSYQMGYRADLLFFEQKPVQNAEVTKPKMIMIKGQTQSLK